MSVLNGNLATSLDGFVLYFLAWQVWRAPTHAKVMAPLQLHRSFGGCADSITTLDWSPDSAWIAVGSKDLTCRCALLNFPPCSSTNRART